jgi:hypothetical protein
MRADRWCACGCGRSIAFHRPQARFYDSTCRKKAERGRKRDAALARHGSLAGERGYFEALDASRGYRDDWSPDRETKVRLGRALQVFDEYADQRPLTCRQVYYRLVAEWKYPKGAKFEGACYRMLENARRAGEIPFSWIRDDGIISTGSWWNSARQAFESWELTARYYSREVQQGLPKRVQVWCEAAGMVPQLATVADRYGVRVHSSGGFNSLTAVRQMVDSCRDDAEDSADETVLLYLGDADPSGYSIFQAATEDVAAFLEEDCPWHAFTAERVALTLEQVEDLELASDAIMTNDSRSKVWRKRGLTRKTELEALAPDKLAELLTAALQRHIDRAHIKAVREQEQIDREMLLSSARSASRVWGEAA